MNDICTIHSIDPGFAIPDGEISVFCEVTAGPPGDLKCLFNGVEGEVTAASNSKLLVRVPSGLEDEFVEVQLSVNGVQSDTIPMKVGLPLCGDMHIVSNPAVDPNDGSIVLTRSGARGQQLSATMFRLRDGEVEEMSVDILNPTAVAFDGNGKLVVTNRAEGKVIQVNDDTDTVVLASDLGVATGIAFDSDKVMYVGDRSGTVFKISAMGDAREWAGLEPSVSAFHMAFGPDDTLYVTAPGLCSHDVIHKVPQDGESSEFFKGLGRPQGLAFDDEGNLYVAACLRGRHGIVRISENGEKAELWVAGMSIVGLCFDELGGLLVATSDSLYRLSTDTYGVLLK